MTFTLNEILNIVPILQKLQNQPFKGRAVFHIVKTMRAFENEIKSFEEARGKIIEKYCARDKNNQMIITNNQVKIKEDKIEDCNAELTELLSTICEVNIEPIPFEWFENIDFTPNDFIFLEKIISPL